MATYDSVEERLLEAAEKLAGKIAESADGDAGPTTRLTRYADLLTKTLEALATLRRAQGSGS